MADLTGVTMAHSLLKGNRTQEQWFFSSFAQMWASSYDQDTRCKLVNSDVHALPDYRVDKTLRQYKSFQNAFGCGDDSNMVKEAGKRCVMYGK